MRAWCAVLLLLAVGCSSGEHSVQKGTTPSPISPAPVVATTAPPPTSPRPTAAAALPNSFVVSSVTATSASDGYVLGTSHNCHAITCTRLLRTTDGFQTFSAVTPPPAPVRQGDPATIGINDGTLNAVSDIRADGDGDLWAFGQVLLTRHHGGPWTKVPDMGDVVQLEVSASEVVAITCASVANQCGMGDYGVMRSPRGTDAFRPAPLPKDVRPRGGAELAISGTHVAILDRDTDGKDRRALYESADSGRSWQVRVLEVNQKSSPALTITSAGRTCLLQSLTGADRDEATCNVEARGGWSDAKIGFQAPTAFAAFSTSRQLAASEDKISLTTDGKTFRPVILSGADPKTVISFVGFTDELHAFALDAGDSTADGEGKLWHTSDGGVTWSKVRFPAAS